METVSGCTDDSRGAYIMNTFNRFLFTALGVLELTSGVLGNSFLLIALYVQSTMRRKTVHSIFLLNLTVADSLALIYVLPLCLQSLIDSTYLLTGWSYCQASGFLLVFFPAASVLGLLAMSFHRFLRVCHVDLHKKVLTVRSAILCCLLCWLVALLVALAPAVRLFGSYQANTATSLCSFTSRDLTERHLVNVALAFPLCVAFAVGYCNWAIYRHWQLSRPGNAKSEQQQAGCLGNQSADDANEAQESAASGGGSSDVTAEDGEDGEKAGDGIPHVGTQRVARGSEVQMSGPAPAENVRASPGNTPPCSARAPARAIAGDTLVRRHHGRHEKQLISSLIVIVIMASCSFGAFTVVQLAGALTDSFPERFFAATFLLLLNSSVNWILYGVTNRRLREDLFHRLRWILSST